MPTNNVFRTTLEFVFKDKASAGLHSVATATERARKGADTGAASFKSLAGAFTALVVAKHAKNAILSLIEPARKMEQAMMRLAFTMGKGGPLDKSVQLLRGNAESVAEFTVFGPQAAMDATVQLNRALRDTSSTMDATRIAAGLAQASFGKMTLEKSAGMVAQMAKAFGFAAEDIRIAGDKVFAVARHTGTGVENFAGIMGRLAMAGKLGEQSFDGMLQSFALINRMVPNAKSASNLMVSMMAKLSTTKAQAAFKSMNVSILDAQMRIRPLVSILLELAKQSKISSVGVRMGLTKAFGARQIKPMLAMLGGLQRGIKGVNGESLTTSKLLTKLNEVLKTADGSLQKGINKSMQTADAQMRRAGESWMKFKTILGEQLLPILKPLADGFANLISVIIEGGKILAEIPGLKTAFKVVTAFIAGAIALKAFRLASMGVGMILASVNALLAANATVTIAASAATLEYTVVTQALQKLMAVGKIALFAAAITAVVLLIKYVKELNAETKELAKRFAKVPKGFEGKIRSLSEGGIFGVLRAKMLIDEVQYQSVIMSAERLRTLEAKKRAIMLQASAKQASMLLQLGSQPFEDTIGRLENLVKSKPKEFKTSDVVQAQNWLRKVQATPVGGMTVTPSGKRMQVTEHMVSAARNAIALSQGAMQTLHTSVRTGEGISTGVATQVASAMKALNLAVKATVDPESKKLIKAGAAPALAMLHQLKGKQVGATTATRKLSGVTPSIAPDSMLSKFAAMTQGKFLAGRRARGELTGKAPAAGAFLTDERRQVTQMGAFDRAEQVEKENAKDLGELRKEMKLIRVNLERIQKFGLKMETKSDPGVYQPGLFAGGKM